MRQFSGKAKLPTPTALIFSAGFFLNS